MGEHQTAMEAPSAGHRGGTSCRERKIDRHATTTSTAARGTTATAATTGCASASSCTVIAGSATSAAATAIAAENAASGVLEVAFTDASTC